MDLNNKIFEIVANVCELPQLQKLQLSVIFLNGILSGI